MQLLTTSDAARRLGLSAAMVRWLERQGRIAAIKTASGTRLFLMSEIARYATERAEKKHCIK